MRRAGVRFVLATAMLSVGMPAFAAPPDTPQMMKHEHGGSDDDGLRGWRPTDAWCRLYDAKTVETLAGEVISVYKVGPVKDQARGVHMKLKTDGGEKISVHLGPQDYLDRQSVAIYGGDRVTVEGSRVTFAGKPAIIADFVRKGDQVLVLRAGDRPAWVLGEPRGDTSITKRKKIEERQTPQH